MRGRKEGGEDNINGNLKRDQRSECNRIGRNMMKMNLRGGGDCVFWEVDLSKGVRGVRV